MMWLRGRDTDPRMCRMLNWGEVEVGDILVIAAVLQTVTSVDDDGRVVFESGNHLHLAYDRPILSVCS